MSSREVRGFVDRFEEDRAVILVGETGWEIVWPTDELPGGVREGTVLHITLRTDDEATRLGEEVVDSLIERLRRRD